MHSTHEDAAENNPCKGGKPAPVEAGDNWANDGSRPCNGGKMVAEENQPVLCRHEVHAVMLFYCGSLFRFIDAKLAGKNRAVIAITEV